ncbi:MAG: hypothetical protein ACRCY4_10410 [Brevinema sp.]
MKKTLFFLFFFTLVRCSITPMQSSTLFVNNLISGNYCMVEYASEDTGTVALTGDLNDEGNPISVRVFKDVARVSSGNPLQLVSMNGSYTGSFIHINLLYTFERMYDENSAIYSYTFYGRSAETANTSFKAYVGFRIQDNGLYTLDKKSWDMGTTLESTLAFYSVDNINFTKVEGGPLYQKLGTTPVF